MTTSAGPIGEPEQQTDVVAFLESPGALQPCESARRIDTHAAHIFLAGDRAWKLKRSVHFNYLDFSSADKRHAALETELTLNRRTAPALYLAVRPICRDGSGTLNLDRRGDTVDWLLEMRRFPDGALLEEIAARGELNGRLITRLADQIKAFHDDAEQCRLQHGLDRVEAVISGNRASMAGFPEILPSAAASSLVDRQIEHAVRHAALLDARARQGRVRHGHGDLHLANIAVIDDNPMLFDCLEFSASLATIDVLYDLAFLLMDLWARGFDVQANMLLNRYLDIAPQDEAGIALIPLFLSVRATIRAHALAAQAAGSPDSDLAHKAQHYLALADELLAPVPPRLVAIGGLSGTGKSTIARLVGHCLGRAPGARILRSDVLRKRLAGVQPETALLTDAYTSTASAAVYGELERLASHTLQAGQAVIADAVYAKPEERDAISRLARRHGVSFEGIWLEAAPDLLKQRITARANDASDADTAVAEAQARYDIGGVDWHRVGADGPREAVAGKVRAIIGDEDR
ncbi:bifunctional aminoglycoside phosphotransferase/ATP-binding protein [Sphingobium sp. D43FB]|uniref:bifunctional aminoglycoside phosphotransferase/ATP-binding protein n=1 Tax=Sphingobium sp. D43FB TaxID=2017595 RepID=UPI000BB530C0|nr:bifunctional aminoglycoside phosphotransferase/ATP-binding protein [Sphingobium sp. D43FB]PBN42932.1 aminoglycoside phosphotransferase [Sphingobium sp. D43FB]